MKRHVLAVCAMLALASGAAHAIPFDRIPLISNPRSAMCRTGCAPGRLPPRARLISRVRPIALTSPAAGCWGWGRLRPRRRCRCPAASLFPPPGKPAVPACMWGRMGMWGLGRQSPQSKLEVAGNVALTGVSTSQLNLGWTTYTVSNSATSTISFYHQWQCRELRAGSFPAAATEPCECTFDDPSLGQNLETDRMIGALDDF